MTQCNAKYKQTVINKILHMNDSVVLWAVTPKACRLIGSRPKGIS